MLMVSRTGESQPRQSQIMSKLDSATTTPRIPSVSEPAPGCALGCLARGVTFLSFVFGFISVPVTLVLGQRYQLKGTLIFGLCAISLAFFWLVPIELVNWTLGRKVTDRHDRNRRGLALMVLAGGIFLMLIDWFA